MTTNSITAPEGATTFTTWSDLRAAYDHIAAALPEEASDADLDAYLAAWREAMIAEASSDEASEAIQWKVDQFVRGAEDGAFRDDLHQDYLTAIMADVKRPLRDFAEAWLAAWTADGGDAIICPNGRVQFGYPMYELSPRYVAPADHMDEHFAAYFVQTNDQHYHSTMMARLDVLKMLPGGKAAIKARLLGAGPATGAVVSVTGEAFALKLAAYTNAVADRDAYDAANRPAECDGLTPEWSAYEEAMFPLHNAVFDAGEAALLEPAPSVAAIHEKRAIFDSLEYASAGDNPAVSHRLFADAIALAGAER